MLHEILLSLSGHPSPLLRPPPSPSPAAGSAQAHENGGGLVLDSQIISPSERALLASLAHLSDLHVKLISFAAQIAASHPSVICRAVATAVDSIHLSAFQRKVLEVEDSILRKDAGLVGAYNIVPLTAIVGEFDGWTRRMEWLWELVQFMMRVERAKDKDGQGVAVPCTGARVIDWLRGELQTGYQDVEDTARGLVRVAEVAWLKQVSAWILYGKLPSFGAGDFFVQKADEGADEEYMCNSSLLPSFVPPSTAASMLFIGRSLNQIRAKSLGDSSLRGTDHLSTQLTQLSKLTHPLDAATFARTILDIRNFLSRTTLQRLLPLSRVQESLQLLRDFFLLRRGDFAMALTQQADEKIRSRWRRAENLAYEKRDALSNVVVKEGEVAAVLVRTWAAIGSMQGEHAEEDEGLELARDLLRLRLAKSSRQPLTPLTPAATEGGLASIAPTPFRNLLFSVPVVLTLQIPSPLDLFLSQSDLQTYTAINSYLLSLRRAHLRLTDLWKITSLRRHHPAPPGPPYGSTRNGREKVRLLRQRHTARSRILRSAWATASAAIFFLGETEAYLQTEVVAGLSDGFHQWLATGEDNQRDDQGSRQTKLTLTSGKSRPTSPQQQQQQQQDDVDDDNDEDIWLTTSTPSKPKPDPSPSPPSPTHYTHHPKDPQTLATAHRLYLRTLIRRLLLSHASFTNPLYELLVHIDHLVALLHRLHSVWSAADLEADVGVVDAFVDLEREEGDVQREILAVEGQIKWGIEGLIGELRRLEVGGGLMVSLGGGGGGGDHGSEGGDVGGGGGGEMEEEEEFAMREMGEYVPRRVGGVDRLLMKLDFGSWFGGGGGSVEGDFGNDAL